KSNEKKEKDIEDQIRDLQKKKFSELDETEKDILDSYSRQKIDQVSEQLMKLNKESAKRTEEWNKLKSQNVFNVFEDYTGNEYDSWILRINDESTKASESDEETPDLELTNEAKRRKEEMKKI